MRSLIFPGMTSSVSHDVIYFSKNKENTLINLNMELNRNWLVGSKEIDVFVQNGSRSF